MDYLGVCVIPRIFTWCRWKRVIIVAVVFLLLCLLNYEYPSSHISVGDDSENIQVVNLNLKDDTHHSNTSGSFVLALDYYERLTCATQNLLQLCSVAQNLNARVVMPFLLRSLLNGIPDFNSTRRHYYPLSTIYDVPKLNETFHSMTGTHLVTFDQFIQHAPRDIILVDTLYSYEAKTEYKTFNDSGFELFNCPNHLSPDQIDTAQNVGNNLKKHTVVGKVNHFVVKKFICLPRTTHDITTDQIKQFIGIKPHTIVFNQWRGCAYHSCDVKAPRNIVSNARHKILYYSINNNSQFTIYNKKSQANVSITDYVNHCSAPNHLQSKVNDTKESSFLLALNYFEQLTCATRNFLSFGYVAQNLGAKVVIPYLVHSRLYSIPDLLPSREIPGLFYPLNTVYDINKLNETFYSLSKAYLVYFKDFILHAPRDIVLIDIIHKTLAPREFGLIYKDLKKVLLYTSVNKTAFNCNHLVSTWNQPLFHGIELMLRISARYFDADVTTDEIKQLIGPKPQTIIFTQWRNCAYHSCEINAPRTIGNPVRNRILHHKPVQSLAPQSINHTPLPFNNTIKSAAIKYLQSIKIFSPYISLHIRIEKLSRINEKISGHTDCCFGLLDGLLASLKEKYFNQTLMITDISEYGSDACYDKVCAPHAKKVKKMLKQRQLVQYSFDPKVVGSSDSPAFASLAEMHMLAMGDRLIVMGYGSFKTQIITQFLYSHPRNHLYHICTESGNILNEFGNLDVDCFV
ncbi:uncharacterized protein [Dysidea avara]|uniref:uncharacterized protein isoform X2 n=1 Tax=Dysidea avara TaxID=196820 RepID=UPI00331D9253